MSSACNRQRAAERRAKDQNLRGDGAKIGACDVAIAIVIGIAAVALFWPMLVVARRVSMGFMSMRMTDRRVVMMAVSAVNVRAGRHAGVAVRVHMHMEAADLRGNKAEAGDE